MYNNARSQVRVGCEYSEEFEVGVGVHQGSVLSPLLFLIVLEALSRDFRVGVPWELFFADDLVIIATSLEECVERVKAWKEGLESKGLHVNMTKTKFMASGLGLDILQDSGKFPCAVCRTGVGRSSIRCSKCNLWVHYKKCSGLKTLSEDLSYEFPRCRGVPGIRPVDGCPFKEVEVGDCVLEAVDRFCYLGDTLSAGGGCMAAAIVRCRCAWGKFRENLPLLTSKPVPFDLRGRLFSSNVRSSMLHGTETWPMTSAALHRLCRNDRAMIRWICGVKPSDDPSMDELHAKLVICDLAILVRERRLRWFGHVMRSNGEIDRVRSRPVPGRKGPGRPKKTWEDCVKQDLKVCGLSEAGTQDRLSWRSSVKNSRQEPTPTNGSLLQSLAAPPARCVLGMRTRSFNKTGFDWLIDWSHSGVWTLSETTTLTSPMLYLYIPASHHTTECGHYQKPQPWRAPCCIFTFQHLITRRSVDIIRNHNPDEPHVVHLHSNIWSHDGVWILSETTTLTSPMLYIYIPASDHTTECGYYQKPQPWRAPCCTFTFQHLITRRSVDIIRNHNLDEPHVVYLHSSIWSHDGVWILSETTTLTSPMLYIYIPTSDHTTECGYYQKPQPWRAPCCIFTFQHLITQRSVDIIRNHNPDEPHVVYLHSSIWSHSGVWILSETTTLTSRMLYTYIPASDHTTECGHHQKPQPGRSSIFICVTRGSSHTYRGISNTNSSSWNMQQKVQGLFSYLSEVTPSIPRWPLLVLLSWCYISKSSHSP